MRSLQALRIPVLVAIAIGVAPKAPGQATTYDDLLTLFEDWRSFQKPTLAGGVPDYTPAAMAAQRRALAGYRKRLAAIDSTGWPVPQKVDYQVVRAEMNGLDFDHRVLQPWARNPAFYVTVVADESDQPAREGPFAYGTVELFRWRFPLTEAQADELAARLAPVPALLQQARGNLTGNARDLWRQGIRAQEQQRNVLAQLRDQAAPHPALGAAVARALEATEEFVRWLKAQAASKDGPSGVGVENYDWYLANVQLLPYTWAGELTLTQRELARATAALALEEHRNRGLPKQAPVASGEEHQRRFGGAVTEYMAFLAQRDILSVRPDMDAALRARVGQYTATRPLEFFTEVDYRDPVLMRTHGYHWFDLARMQRQPHPSPIRRGALLYNIFDSRTEGLATAMEELMMQAGLCDTRPRSRELVYILLAQRAARAIGDLRMHANEWSIEQAARFASSNTPRGWLRLDGETVWFEQHLYLQQPGYGTSYVIGKLEVDQLIAARHRALGGDFTLRRFMDELDGAGLVPISLVRWELTGDGDRVPGVGWAQSAPRR
ncbi:MAG TPA: DUF885 family protein [Myxococcales bacterium]